MTNLQQQLPPETGDMAQMEDDDLSPARGFFNGLGTAVVFWLFVAGLALALGARP